MTFVLRDDRSAKTVPNPVMRFALDLRRYAWEGGVECTGPSLAFIPLRGTKDYIQDYSLAVSR
jgi:hypothetical protein